LGGAGRAVAGMFASEGKHDAAGFDRLVADLVKEGQTA
jgi:hypothetical protein